MELNENTFSPPNINRQLCSFEFFHSRTLRCLKNNIKFRRLPKISKVTIYTPKPSRRLKLNGFESWRAKVIQFWSSRLNFGFWWKLEGVNWTLPFFIRKILHRVWKYSDSCPHLDWNVKNAIWIHIQFHPVKIDQTEQKSRMPTSCKLKAFWVRNYA